MKKQSNRKVCVAGLILAGLSAQGLGIATAADAEFRMEAPVSDGELSDTRGKQGTTNNLQITAAVNALDAELSDNVASGNTSGANVIRDAAFSGLNGHATVIQNTGNNNIIQDSTIYNFSLSP